MVDFHMPPSGGEECPRAFAIIATCVMIVGVIGAAFGAGVEWNEASKVREARRKRDEQASESILHTWDWKQIAEEIRERNSQGWEL